MQDVRIRTSENVYFPRTPVNSAGTGLWPPCGLGPSAVPGGAGFAGYHGTTLLRMRTLVALLTLVRIRWVMIIGFALTTPLNRLRTRPWLGCAPHCLESAPLPAGHDNGNTVGRRSHHPIRQQTLLHRLALLALGQQRARPPRRAGPGRRSRRFAACSHWTPYPFDDPPFALIRVMLSRRWLSRSA